MKATLPVMLALAIVLLFGSVATPAFAHHKEGHTANCHVFTGSPVCQGEDGNNVRGDKRNNHDDDDGDDDDDENNNSRDRIFTGSIDFSAQGVALTRTNNGLDMADASLDLAGDTFRREGNHDRSNVTGELVIDSAVYDISAQARIKSGKITTIDIVGKSSDNQRLVLRGFLIPSDTDNGLWSFVNFPAGKFGGKTKLFAMLGDVQLEGTLPPTGNKNALNHFEISTIGNQVAGNEFSFTVTAINGFGNVKTDFTGTATVSSNDGNSPAPSNTAPVFNPVSHTFVAGDNGQFTFKATLYNAKSGVTMTALSAGKTGTSNAFTVSPAAIDSVSVTPSPIGVPSGGTQTFEAKAFDQYSNQVSTTFAWEVSPVSGFGSVSPTSSTGTTTFTAETVSTPVTGTVKATAVGGENGSSNVTVGGVPGVLHHFDVSSIGNQVAGTPFIFTVTAKDNNGTTVPGFTGTVNITTNDGNSPAPSNTAPVFNPVSHTFVAGDNGQFTFAATLYNAKEDVTITATDSVDTAKTGTSSEFDVSPAAIDSVEVTSSATSVLSAGTATLEAKAFDQYSNQVSTTFAWEVSPASGFGSVSPTSSTGTTTFTAETVTEATPGTVKATAGGESDTASLTVNPV